MINFKEVLHNMIAFYKILIHLLYIQLMIILMALMNKNSYKIVLNHLIRINLLIFFLCQTIDFLNLLLTYLNHLTPF